MKVGVGHSTAGDSRQAGFSSAQTAVEGSGPPVLSIVFKTDQYDPAAVLQGVKDVTGDSKVVGFCAGGIITSAGVFQQGVGVLCLSGEEIRATTCLIPGLGADPAAVGRRAGEALLARGAVGGTVLVLPDGFSANISAMLRGLYNVMGPDFKYIGGGSGDNLKFFKTYQFTEQGVTSDAVALALIEGVHIETGIGHGWTPIGDPLIITQAKKKRVIEIDGSPAYAAYSKRFGDVSLEQFSEFGMRHPLGFPDIAGNYLIRDPIAVNEDQSIDFVTEIPSNAVGSIMSGEVSHLIATAQRTAVDVAARVERKSFALMFDCISRYLLMGEHFDEEFQAVMDVLDSGLPVLGTLTFGEIGSYEDVPLFHNKTFALGLAGTSK